MTRVLVTAFEPFGGESVNPSQQAVRRLADGPPMDGVELRTAFLPVVFGEAIEALERAIAEHEPDLVLCAGEAGGRFAVTPERVAVNVNDAPFPDNAGNRPVDEPIVPGGPVAYLSTLPVAAIVDALRADGIPAAKSSTAENYVCNNVFYGLMHHIATVRPQLVGGFVHVPYVHEQVVHRLDPQPSMSLDTITRALRIAVTTSVAARGRPRTLRLEGAGASGV
jgi:pyroglutamyl-peptidase